MSQHDDWPVLNYTDWAETAATLHMWTQIVGKIRMERSPWLNHSWHVTLYVTPRGLTTGTIPHGNFCIDFDFHNHRLAIKCGTGAVETLPLKPQATADFYQAVMAALDKLDLSTRINTTPNELPDPIPFDEDRVHASYDAAAVHRFWRALSSIDRVFNQFRAGFDGKSSPSHFFWGSFDLAVTRFSGRAAPDHPGGLPNMPLWVAQEAYSQEVSSAGFWPGGAASATPIFYAYTYPTPDGYAQATVQPPEAAWSTELGEFVLPYDAVRAAADPDATLMLFLETTFDAAVEHAKWDLGPIRRRHFAG
jgi:hypothetical protein